MNSPLPSEESEQKSGSLGDQASPKVITPVASGSLPNTLADPRTSDSLSRKRGSMRAAINAFCKGCIYDQTQPGTWRQQVEACTSKRCALFQFRPISTVIEEAEETA